MPDNYGPNNVLVDKILTDREIIILMPGREQSGPASETFEMMVSEGISDLDLSPQVVKGELKDAYSKLSAHGLLHSAKWVAEQAAGVGRGIKAIMPAQSTEDVDSDEEDAIILGKSFFDVREYR